MRLVLRFLHDSRFPSLPDGAAPGDPTPVEWRTPYCGETRATVRFLCCERSSVYIDLFDLLLAL
jgi:hypothetical protein